MALSSKKKQDVYSKICWEGGFDCLVTYSAFPEIKDPMFRGLVDAYINAHKALETYFEDCVED